MKKTSAESRRHSRKAIACSCSASFSIIMSPSPCFKGASTTFVSHLPVEIPSSSTRFQLCRRKPPVVARTDFGFKKTTSRDPSTVGPIEEAASVDRKVWSAGEQPPPTEEYPPGRMPFALELNFLFSHPVTESIITLLVILNCFAFALQTIDLGPILHEVFRGYENNVSILFLIEYFGRWYGKGFSPRFLLTRRMIIDFFAVAPIGFAVADQSEALFVRLLRLTRIFRLERMVMDSESKEGMMKGMTNVQIQLASIGLSLFSLLYVSAGLFFQVEKDVNPGVRNFFDAFYFSTVTLFTVGFGDVTPLTSAGRIITVMTVLTGAVLIPFKLSEVDRVRRLGMQKDAKKGPVVETDLPPSGDFRTPMFTTRIECTQCHLRGHQIDARFCRNCGTLLAKRRFDR